MHMYIHTLTHSLTHTHTHTHTHTEEEEEEEEQRQEQLAEIAGGQGEIKGLRVPFRSRVLQNCVKAHVRSKCCSVCCINALAILLKVVVYVGPHADLQCTVIMWISATVSLGGQRSYVNLLRDPS